MTRSRRAYRSLSPVPDTAYLLCDDKQLKQSVKSTQRELWENTSRVELKGNVYKVISTSWKDVVFFNTWEENSLLSSLPAFFCLCLSVSIFLSLTQKYTLAPLITILFGFKCAIEIFCTNNWPQVGMPQSRNSTCCLFPNGHLGQFAIPQGDSFFNRKQVYFPQGGMWPHLTPEETAITKDLYAEPGWPLMQDVGRGKIIHFSWLPLICPAVRMTSCFLQTQHY